MIASPYSGLAELLEPRAGPCLSLYQPMHRPFPAKQQNPVRYKNLLGALRASLGNHPAAAELLDPLERLQEDAALWEHPSDGLVVFSAPGFFRVYRLQRPVPELALVAESLHVKPLVRILQTTDRYQVLVLDRDKIALYEGNRDALDEVDLAPGVPPSIEDALGEELTEPYSKVETQRAGPERPMHHGHGSRKDEFKLDAERFFRVVDKAILEHHSRPSRLPLVLAALPEHQGLFRQLSRNPYLVDEGLATNAAAMDLDELRRAAWDVVEPRHHEQTRVLAENFAEATAKGLGSNEAGEIRNAAETGRVDSLMLAAEGDAGDADDLLDDIAVTVLRKKGDVHVVSPAHMPGRTAIAAIFRY